MSEAWQRSLSSSPSPSTAGRASGSTTASSAGSTTVTTESQSCPCRRRPSSTGSLSRGLLIQHRAILRSRNTLCIPAETVCGGLVMIYQVLNVNTLPTFLFISSCLSSPSSLCSFLCCGVPLMQKFRELSLLLTLHRISMGNLSLCLSLSPTSLPLLFDNACGINLACTLFRTLKV